MFYQKFMVNTEKSFVKQPGIKVKTNNIYMAWTYHISSYFIPEQNK